MAAKKKDNTTLVLLIAAAAAAVYFATRPSPLTANLNLARTNQLTSSSPATFMPIDTTLSDQLNNTASPVLAVQQPLPFSGKPLQLTINTV